MPTNSEWLATAKGLYTGPFSGQTNNTIILESIKSGYNTQEVIATYTTGLARVYGFKVSQYNGESIQVGDRRIGLINENLTVIPKVGGVNCTVNGVSVQILSASTDEAGAVYTLHVRDL